MDDRTLLEMAARAAGIEGEQHAIGIYIRPRDPTGHAYWNPLTSDADALRLAVKRRFHINIFSAIEEEGIFRPGFVEIWGEDGADPIHTEHVEAGDYEAATRRAIVRAAASIGAQIGRTGTRE